jgi:hypothetical protein
MNFEIVLLSINRNSVLTILKADMSYFETAPLKVGKKFEIAPP